MGTCLGLHVREKKGREIKIKQNKMGPMMKEKDPRPNRETGNYCVCEWSLAG